jgi:hypothetical protein
MIAPHTRYDVILLVMGGSFWSVSAARVLNLPR